MIGAHHPAELPASGHRESRLLGVATDQLAGFEAGVLAIRWGTLSVGLSLAALSAGSDGRTLAWCAVVVAYALWRSIRPLRYLDDRRSVVPVLVEVGVHVAAVIGTGYWDSPLILSLATAVAVAGLASGFNRALVVSVGTIVAVSVPSLIFEDLLRQGGAQFALVLVLVAGVAGYARRVLGEADRQRTFALDRMGRLTDANELLVSLHGVAQTLPATFDLDEALDSTLARLRDHLDGETFAVLLADDTDRSWLAARQVNSLLPARLAAGALPRVLQHAVSIDRIAVVDDLDLAGLVGVGVGSGSGLYSVLRSRDAVIGMVAVEHPDVTHFTGRHQRLLAGIVEPAALAIDNARWFARLRTLGAEEERTRIARSLHDRVGGSLAYVGIELDRILRLVQRGQAADEALTELRTAVRGIVGEVRETLHDLRVDVSDDSDLPSVMEQHLHRVGQRTGMAVVFHDGGVARLPLPQERAMLRIAQEAVAGIERRQPRPPSLSVWWRCDGYAAVLEVLDDGLVRSLGADVLDGGILGLRERADSIGATVDVGVGARGGTRLRCALGDTSALSDVTAGA